MKRLLSLLMVIAMLTAALTGCGGKNETTGNDTKEPTSSTDISSEKELTDEEKIVGNWECDFDMSEQLAAVFGEEVDVTMQILLDCKKDGTMKMEADVDKLKEDMIPLFEDIMINSLIANAAEGGTTISEEEAVQILETQVGMTMEKYLEGMVAEMTESMESEFSSKGTYEIKDGMLYTEFEDEDEDADTEEDGGKKITFKGNDEMTWEDDEMSMTFKRVK